MTMKDYGTVTYQGKVYTLTGDAYASNNLMWARQDENGVWAEVWECPAVDGDGSEYKVIWDFGVPDYDMVDGEVDWDSAAIEADSLPWEDDSNIIEVVSL